MEAGPNEPPRGQVKAPATLEAAPLWAVLLGLGFGVVSGAAVGIFLGFVVAIEGLRHFGQGCAADDAGPCGSALGLAALFLGSMPGLIFGGFVGGVVGLILSERRFTGRWRRA